MWNQIVSVTVVVLHILALTSYYDLRIIDSRVFGARFGFLVPDSKKHRF